MQLIGGPPGAVSLRPHESIDLRAVLDTHGARGVQAIHLILHNPRLYAGIAPALTLVEARIATTSDFHDPIRDPLDAPEALILINKEDLRSRIRTPQFRRHGQAILEDLEEAKIVTITLRNNSHAQMIVAASIAYAAMLSDPIQLSKPGTALPHREILDSRNKPRPHDVIPDLNLEQA
jgi:hypothetical protein